MSFLWIIPAISLPRCGMQSHYLLYIMFFFFFYSSFIYKNNFSLSFVQPAYTLRNLRESEKSFTTYGCAAAQNLEGNIHKLPFFIALKSEQLSYRLRQPLEWDCLWVVGFSDNLALFVLEKCFSLINKLHFELCAQSFWKISQRDLCCAVWI